MLDSNQHRSILWWVIIRCKSRCRRTGNHESPCLAYSDRRHATRRGARSSHLLSNSRKSNPRVARTVNQPRRPWSRRRGRQKLGQTKKAALPRPPASHSSWVTTKTARETFQRNLNRDDDDADDWTRCDGLRYTTQVIDARFSARCRDNAKKNNAAVSRSRQLRQGCRKASGPGCLKIPHRQV